MNRKELHDMIDTLPNELLDKVFVFLDSIVQKNTNFQPEVSFVLDDETIALLDRRNTSPIESFITREDSNKRLKAIRGV